MIGAEQRLSRMGAFGIAALCLALAVIPFLTTTTSLRQASQIIVSVLAVLGVNVATGYGGMISLGHGVFVGVGAFATGYYVDDLSMPWLLAITLGAATAGIAYMAGSGGGSLFGSTSLKEKLMSYASKEAIKRGKEAIFGGDDEESLTLWNAAVTAGNKFVSYGMVWSKFTGIDCLSAIEKSAVKQYLELKEKL